MADADESNEHPSPEDTTIIAGLPTELWELIIYYIDVVTTLRNLAMTSKMFYDIAHEKIWRSAQFRQIKSAEALVTLNKLPIKYLDVEYCTSTAQSNIGRLFSNFTSLHTLRLGPGALGHVKPSGLADLSLVDLKHLILSGSNANDTHLAEIAAVQSLTKLDITDCQDVTDKGFQCIAKLQNLQKLIATNCNRLTTRGMSYLSSLKQLNCLDIGWCHQIDANALSLIAHLPIEELYMSHAEVDTASLVVINQLSCLKKLDIQSNCFKTFPDDGLLCLSSLSSSLVYLNMANCPDLINKGLPNIQSLAELQILNIRQCTNVTAESLESIAHLELIELNLNSCDVTDLHLAAIRSMESLRKLDISWSNKITPDGLAHLSPLTRLQWLNITGCAVTTGGMKAISHLPLQELFCNCDDECLKNIGDVTSLRQLSIQESSTFVTNQGLSYLASLTKLRYLNISYCRMIKEQGLDTIIHLPIENLVFQHSSANDDCLAAISKMSSLKRIDVSGNDITDRGLMHLEALPKLQYVRLMHCPRLTLAGIEELNNQNININ